MSAYVSSEQISEISKKVDFYLRVHRFDAAEKLLKASLVNLGKNARLFNMLGVTYHKQSRFPEALTFFAKAIKADEKYMEASLNLAATLCDLSRYDAAREIFATISDSIKSPPNFKGLAIDRLASHHIENGRLYEMSGLASDAIGEYTKALSLNKDLFDVRLAIARLCLQNKQMDKAQKILEELVHDAPQMVEGYNLLGLLYYKQGRRDEARRQWERAVHSDPDNLTARAYHRLAHNWNLTQ